ncbi:LAFE_0E12838g1_1 [Lachancea fermentati]|uniref:LAFE_0E12838g1_1 n=1 Tax=Lachancea fermentati TaxID=4955 RepID=A0A1G4MDS1_LACFM|nr:LAFE_0E12838g1_1 [Lachancea fermentati]
MSAEASNKGENTGDKLPTDEYVSKAFSKMVIAPPSSTRKQRPSSIFVPSSKSKFASLKGLDKRKPRDAMASRGPDDLSLLKNSQVIDPTVAARKGNASSKLLENKPDVFFIPVPVDSPSWDGKVRPSDLPSASEPRHSPSNLVDTILSAVSSVENEPVLPVLDIKGLRTTLLPHQLIGVDFLQKRELRTSDNNGFRGGLLCDDMGLGKTIQIIALLLCHKLKQPTLILCPVSLATQWASEINKFAPELRVLRFHGPKRPKDYRSLENYDIVISSYETVRVEWSQLQSSDRTFTGTIFHEKMRWGRAVLDEAHVIKNSQSKTARACFSINAKYRWCVTGTPIQNSLNDLQSLFQFLRLVNLSDAKNWKINISNAVSAGNLNGVTAKLIRELKPMMLRRTKDILKFEKRIQPSKGAKQTFDGPLPKKFFHSEFLSFSAVQRKLYDDIRNEYVSEIDSTFDIVKSERKPKNCEKVDYLYGYNTLRSYLSASKLSIGVNEDAPGRNSRMRILVHLLRLRQLCCDWRLLTDKNKSEYQQAKNPNKRETSNETNDVAALSAKFSAMNMDSDNDSMGKPEKLLFSNEFPSVKVQRLLEILKQERFLDKRHIPRKTIVFSQFTQMLSLLKMDLDFHGIKNCCYFGSMSVAEKDRVKTLFGNEQDCEVMLCSLKSGSLGLNLTMADRVILFDPWWNPAIQDQAIDRVYRIGQKSSRVDVHVFIMKGTVEQEIIELQDRKRNLAKMIADGDKDAMNQLYSKLSTQDLIKLFGVSQE